MRKLLTITLAVFALTAFDCKKTSSADGVFRGSYSTKVEARSPAGVRVVSAARINTGLFADMDRGIANGFRIAQQYGYTRQIGHSNYAVALFPRSPKCINPGFLIAADGSAWDQGEYDKDPRPGYVLLCAAGMAPDGYVMIVADDPGHMFNVTWFETEHWMLFHNDPTRWVDTSGVHAHPILPDREASLTAKTEAGPKFIAITIETPADVEAEGLTVKKGTKVCVLLTK